MDAGKYGGYAKVPTRPLVTLYTTSMCMSGVQSDPVHVSFTGQQAAQ
jgi:hypothetical protein